ncbi:MAG: hypothetical protein E7112_00870 [Bacteroidales bacterium]|nr:hypothetical protein [Bacteroidales bacterium]
MNLANVARVACLHNEMEAIHKMQKIIADTADINLAVGVRTTFVCSLAKNEQHEITSKRMIELFNKALYDRLNEIEKEIELM